MEIKGKVHCFFEQSGTFKREFIKLGIPAEDYDIQNNFGETDHTDDLFQAIEDAYDGKPSLFDNITPDDLIMAFFPCIYFCEANTRLFRFEDISHKNRTHREAVDEMLSRSRNRQHFWELAIKMFCVADTRGLRLINENPYTKIHFLYQYFPYRAKVIDHDRSRRGDYFVKPTQYWFINCEPTDGFTWQQNKQVRAVWKANGSTEKGLCSEERSMISPDYARNFICDFILGKPQEIGQLSIFNAGAESSL